jgi:hypothetical protein
MRRNIPFTNVRKICLTVDEVCAEYLNGTLTSPPPQSTKGGGGGDENVYCSVTLHCRLHT